MAQVAKVHKGTSTMKINLQVVGELYSNRYSASNNLSFCTHRATGHRLPDY